MTSTLLEKLTLYRLKPISACVNATFRRKEKCCRLNCQFLHVITYVNSSYQPTTPQQVCSKSPAGLLSVPCCLSAMTQAWNPPRDNKASHSTWQQRGKGTFLSSTPFLRPHVWHLQRNAAGEESPWVSLTPWAGNEILSHLNTTLRPWNASSWGNNKKQKRAWSCVKRSIDIYSNKYTLNTHWIVNNLNNTSCLPVTPHPGNK